jgi:predicted HTH domain antitoxin
LTSLLPPLDVQDLKLALYHCHLLVADGVSSTISEPDKVSEPDIDCDQQAAIDRIKSALLSAEEMLHLMPAILKYQLVDVILNTASKFSLAKLYLQAVELYHRAKHLISQLMQQDKSLKHPETTESIQPLSSHILCEKNIIAHISLAFCHQELK